MQEIYSKFSKLGMNIWFKKEISYKAFDGKVRRNVGIEPDNWLSWRRLLILLMKKKKL